MEQIKNWISQNKIHLVYITFIIVLVLGAFLFLQGRAVPPVQAITDTTPAGVAAGQVAAGKYTGTDDAADVSHLIQQAQQRPANVVYYTTTQQAADKKAQEIAKADYVLKETKAAPAKGSDSQIQNSYYAITQDKKHRIAAGATYLDHKAYVTVAYTNDRLTYAVHSSDLRGIDGASVMYTVAKW